MTSRMYMAPDGKWHWERTYDGAPSVISYGFISEVDCAEDYWKVNGPGAPVLNYERPKRA
jgi:hypothetical protein